MCVTAIDSLAVYIINLISCILLFRYGKSPDIKVVALFFFFVGQMQIIDFLFWNNLTCNSKNTNITQAGIIFNHLQPIVLFILQVLFGLHIRKSSKVVLLLYLICSIAYSVYVIRKIKCTTLSESTGVIYWKWNDEKFSEIFYLLFFISIMVLCLNFKNTKLRYIFMTFGTLTLIMGMLKPKLNESPGRMWCYYSALIPVFILILVKILKIDD